MTVPTLGKAIEAIEILHNVKPGNINEASNFLTELQQSNYAWSIADQLLYMSRDLITSYFGAQTMRNKIQLHYEELPVESHLSLKESLMKHLKNVTAGTNSTVATQLSLALADLFCHMVQWTGSLDEIIATYSQQAHSVPVLLDVLKYIPEEFSNRSLRLGVNRKNQIFGELDRCSKSAVRVMEQALSLPGNEPSVLVKCLECLDSWFVINLFRDDDLEQSPLIAFVYEMLERPADCPEPLFKAAAQVATDFFSNDWQTIPRLTCRFQTSTYRLETAYRACEQAGRDDLCLQYAQIFCEMGQALLPAVLESPQFESGPASPPPCPSDCRTLHMLLLAANTNRDCCALVLDVLINVTDNHNPYLSEENRQRLAPIFEQLISIMTRHCSVSSCSEEHSLSSYRADVFFVMEQIRMFVDMESVFRKMLGDLSQLLMDDPSNHSNNGATVRFNDAEAVLCMIGSLVKFVDTDAAENASWTEQLLGQVVLPAIGRAQPSFQGVAFTMFGELCRWASRREPILDCMIREMATFVLEAAIDPTDELAVGAFNAALQSLATFCKRLPVQLLRESRWALILAMCRRFPELGFVTKEIVLFYEALGKALCVPHSAQALAQLEQAPDRLAQMLLALCQINVELVERLVVRATGPTGTGTVSRAGATGTGPRDPSDPCVWIDNLSALFVSMGRMVTGRASQHHNRHQHQHHDDSTSDESGALPVVDQGGHLASSSSSAVSKQPYLEALYSVMEQYLWPVLAGLIDCFIADGRVLERVVRILRYSLRCFQMLVKPLLGAIAHKIVLAYQTSRESCFLYVGGILVDEFGGDPECTQGLIQMFHAFSGTALDQLEGSGLHENPNTTEDLFRLMVRLVQRCSPAFLGWQSLQVEQLLGMAVRAMPGTNTDAKALALRFLVEAVNCASSTEESHLAVRQRVCAWLHAADGLSHLWQAVLYMCRWCSDELIAGDLVEDLSELLGGVRALSDRASFVAALDGALAHIGVARRDGLLYATEAQIDQFRVAMTGGGFSSQTQCAGTADIDRAHFPFRDGGGPAHLLEGLEAFAKLFS